MNRNNLDLRKSPATPGGGIFYYFWWHDTCERFKITLTNIMLGDVIWVEL